MEHAASRTDRLSLPDPRALDVLDNRIHSVDKHYVAMQPSIIT
jgi:hypothetical protein